MKSPKRKAVLLSKGKMSKLNGGNGDGCCICNPGEGITMAGDATSPPPSKAALNGWDPMLCAPEEQ